MCRSHIHTDSGVSAVSAEWTDAASYTSYVNANVCSHTASHAIKCTDAGTAAHSSVLFE